MSYTFAHTFLFACAFAHLPLHTALPAYTRIHSHITNVCSSAISSGRISSMPLLQCFFFLLSLLFFFLFVFFFFFFTTFSLYTIYIYTAYISFFACMLHFLLKTKHFHFPTLFTCFFSFRMSILTVGQGLEQTTYPSLSLWSLISSSAFCCMCWSSWVHAFRTPGQWFFLTAGRWRCLSNFRPLFCLVFHLLVIGDAHLSFCVFCMPLSRMQRISWWRQWAVAWRPSMRQWLWGRGRLGQLNLPFV